MSMSIYVPKARLPKMGKQVSKCHYLKHHLVSLRLTLLLKNRRGGGEGGEPNSQIRLQLMTLRKLGLCSSGFGHIGQAVSP